MWPINANLAPQLKHALFIYAIRDVDIHPSFHVPNVCPFAPPPHILAPQTGQPTLAGTNLS